MLERLFALSRLSINRSLVWGFVLVLAFSFMFGGLDVFIANPSVDDTDWTMFQHDLAHSGSSPSSAPNTNNTLWTYTTNSAYSSPTVVNGAVHSADISEGFGR